jgi:hypothetical protein
VMTRCALFIIFVLIMYALVLAVASLQKVYAPGP